MFGGSLSRSYGTCTINYVILDLIFISLFRGLAHLCPPFSQGPVHAASVCLVVTRVMHTHSRTVYFGLQCFIGEVKLWQRIWQIILQNPFIHVPLLAMSTADAEQREQESNKHNHHIFWVKVYRSSALFQRYDNRVSSTHTFYIILNFDP